MGVLTWIAVSNVWPDIAQWVIAPLFTAGVCAVAILLYRDNNSRKERMDTVEQKVQAVKTSFDNFRYYLIGNPDMPRDNGALGDLESKIDRLLDETRK